ncbi:bifunctional ADP-dependent NAD(P)H-hydrate dehydratase/NAD(P)H-hydrate epimerase [Rhodoferax saidenbachensis]|uniref:Bifunctional NAD(P)H-hydrate repair enzyme n=1 Tax=Rhodoferax saidenbachensis TaxID=1484693 RepID=A0A1P8K8M2_9BURK|nr:bifunctional ADP-dependent NAD(P)H-hydrate dehydratase/NAD(P)H-hydrate epimerase [Rhodoferax saidenbachensis]APW42329.1 bifunctional ADP-dependent (S)-NAD(P)H-hydrate dehydratase/NAD(P)H-hydrate epimerase [Rhodoferax saidenbachensis]
MSTNSEQVLGPLGPVASHAYPLCTVQHTRLLETQAASSLVTHTLMQRAGLALAQLTLAHAPHARTFWVACGRGNNGGDGLEAAMHLQQWGKTTIVTLLDGPTDLPADAAQSLERARQAGVVVADAPPAQWDVCIDALLGIGLRQAPTGATLQHIRAIRAGSGLVVAADLPSGLQADTGHTPGECVHADVTLSFLTLKPGLLTAQGRDACGDLWLNTLDVAPPTAPDAWVNAPGATSARAHASHKGSFGDVAVLGGTAGMAGAALLAASAALHAGAGRVYLGLLDATQAGLALAFQPELMVKPLAQWDLGTMAIVAGCGGGAEIAAHLPQLIQHARQLVLDADALNALAAQPAWIGLVASRQPGSTVLTPHPLEAARLLDTTTAAVQADRLASAQVLANRFGCTVVLKGSGSVIAAPGQIPRINPTGNACLATAGTGDVLAGLVGSLMAQGHSGWKAACLGVYRHGQAADHWQQPHTLTAAALAKYI